MLRASSCLKRLSSRVITRLNSTTPVVTPPESPVKSVIQHRDDRRSGIIAADVISGAPEEMKERTVKIYKPTKTAMQSGHEQTRFWQMDFNILGESNRWENPLMGWASSADSVQAIALKFRSKEDAIQFAEKQGWGYTVEKTHEVWSRKKMYADNFKYSPKKLRLVMTK